MILTRRSLIIGAAVSLTAPAIVRFESIMPVRAVLITPMLLWEDILSLTEPPIYIFCRPNFVRRISERTAKIGFGTKFGS